MRYKTVAKRLECSGCGRFVVVLPNPPTDRDYLAAIKKHARSHRDAGRMEKE